MVAPTEKLVQALITQAQPKTTINGTTVSVMIGEDIPLRSLKSEVFSYLENHIISMVVVSMSKIVFTHFHLDTFQTTSLNTPSTTTFYEQYRSPNDYGGLSDIAKMESAPCTAYFKAYTTHLTNVAIVAYGPGDTDYALLYPIRNPGSLKYNSATQAMKAEEITLSISAMDVLDSLVRRRLVNVGSSLYNWKFDNVIGTTGLKQHIQDIKDKIVQAENEHMYKRMKASTKRRQDETKNMKKESSHQQYDQLKEQDSSRRDRGLVYTKVPCPPAMVLFSEEHQTWFMSAKVGTDMQRVDVATGNNPMDGLNEDEKEEYLRKRRFGVYGDHADREKNALQRIKDMAQTLGNMDHWMDIDKLPIMARCSTCGYNFIKQHNSSHYCNELETMITSQQQGLQYFRILYLHGIVDAWIDADMEELFKLEQHDAATILNQHQYQNISNRVPGSLGLIYSTVDTSDEFLFVMAVDKSIINNGPGRGNTPNNLNNDAWFFDNHELMNTMITHFNNNPIRQIAEISCGVLPACNYYSFRYPYRSGANSPVQHKHNRKNSKCHIGQSDMEQKVQ
ncbi:hypothetical protein K492DRAFT_199258 [Lichtheimia hyalospora FSU 10163]|nr:hypothetical protein K492DRAFT_199258 [Lichtheimia hyalospora FSU 10163]